MGRMYHYCSIHRVVRNGYMCWLDQHTFRHSAVHHLLSYCSSMMHISFVPTRVIESCGHRMQSYSSYRVNAKHQPLWHLYMHIAISALLSLSCSRRMVTSRKHSIHSTVSSCPVCVVQQHGNSSGCVQTI